LLGETEIEVREFRFGGQQTATQIQQAGGAGRQNARPEPPPTPSVMVPSETSGFQTLYFVFKNEAARDIDPLFTLSGIRFINE
jgi:hypothetical protein